jgi:hypothetical protein
MSNTHNHAIHGVILKDAEVYVPLKEVVKFCKRFPTVPSAQLSEVIENSIKVLMSDPERVATMPTFTTDAPTK